MHTKSHALRMFRTCNAAFFFKEKMVKFCILIKTGMKLCKICKKGTTNTKVLHSKVMLKYIQLWCEVIHTHNFPSCFVTFLGPTCKMCQPKGKGCKVVFQSEKT